MARGTQAEPLKVLIVGAGIGGLSLAIGLRQEGHEVTLLERASAEIEIGAAVVLPPNCRRILKRWGVDSGRFDAVPIVGYNQFKPDGTLAHAVDSAELSAKWDYDSVACHRIQFHSELKRMATSSQGEGKPAIIKDSSRVVEVDTTNTIVTLEDGSTVEADLIIGADGVASITRRFVCPDVAKPFDSGKSAFRFLIPRQPILDNPVTKDMFGQQGRISSWIAGERRIIMYPCANNTIMNFVAIYPSRLLTKKEGDWGHAASKDSLLKMYEDFSPEVRALLELADTDSVKAWTLLDMERIPRWVKGRVALMGDAAHPFLPYQGQGAAMAIEEACALSVLLPRGTQRSEIDERLALYEQIRDERPHKIQEISRKSDETLDRDSYNTQPSLSNADMYFRHDEYRNSCEALEKHLAMRNGVTQQA